MRAFTQLVASFDHTNEISEQVAALEDYFRRTPPADAAWALWFLSGRRLKRAVKTTQLRRWAAEFAELPLWLVDACHEQVGDLGETLALILPANPRPAPPTLALLVEQTLSPLERVAEAAQRALLRATWRELDPMQCILWHRLIIGNFRAVVPRALLVRALAGLARINVGVMAHRLDGDWRPTPEGFAGLLAGEAPGGDPARPYPFHLALPIAGEPCALGDPSAWQCEWKWDGIRAQLLCRAGEVILWSRGEEAITAAFPEVVTAARELPDGTVLDGELLAWHGDGPLPFDELRRRLRRRAPGARARRATPIVFMACDLLERDGIDCRAWPLTRRRQELEAIVHRVIGRLTGRGTRGTDREWRQTDLFPDQPASPALPPPLRVSPALPVSAWSELANLRARARSISADGLLLKRRDAPYGAGRQSGAWWKWKAAPFTCAAVLVAAQSGHGRRARLFTDYTFAVWQGNELVSVARTHSGLNDSEREELEVFIGAHTTGRHGPVHAVHPELVFELAYEGLTASARHRAGFTLRSPRIVHWRHDKKPTDADTVETLRGSH